MYLNDKSKFDYSLICCCDVLTTNLLQVVDGWNKEQSSLYQEYVFQSARDNLSSMLLKNRFPVRSSSKLRALPNGQPYLFCLLF